MKEFKEFDARLEAKSRAEFITPKALREFMAKKVQGNDLSVLDPAIGSGQLLFEFANRIKIIDGYDINDRAIEYAKDNFKGKITAIVSDYITSDNQNKYDCAISNYPFSIRPNEIQRNWIKSHAFFSQFYRKDITGVLDFIFIIKSFMQSKEGYYICFPGIGYRTQEKTFRQYLIDNKLIKEYGIITNCKFDHTEISVLFLHLSHELTDNPKSFLLDLSTGEEIIEPANFNDYQFITPKKEIAREVIDPIKIEQYCRDWAIKGLIQQIRISKLVAQTDSSLTNNINSINSYIDDCIRRLEEEKERGI